ncbi:MAG: aconitate hydratase [Erysipelotrichaceae bacterium]|nr:aconitate hydratase [Erysipelotrichaceae bacterium]
MKKSIARKIIESHLVSGEMTCGSPIQIKIDTTLTQDATGTMAYLQLEALGINRVKTMHSVSYVDHNTLQNGFMNADDHKYLQTVASAYGVDYSKAGNGICHQVNLERFDIPGQTLLGSDSHTPTAGAMAMIAIGAGGLDVALAMAGMPYSLKMPKIINVQLKGTLHHGVSAKDIILKVLQKLSVKGGVECIMEYTGDIKQLSIPERSTICNMGAELGATTSLFPSDEVTKEFLTLQKRPEDYIELLPDEDAEYDDIIEINLDQLKPMVAKPHQPDNVVEVSELKGMKVDQICIGSCTNSSFTDLATVANILKDKTVHPDVSLTISFGSKQVLRALAASGHLETLIASGARLLESTCGPCIGMGQSPKTDAVSLRTFNRNFFGRSGTSSAGIYLVSPETAALSAITGVISDPSEAEFTKASMPESIVVDDSMILKPEFISKQQIIKGPNIKPFPVKRPLSDIHDEVLLKLEDNISTDHIMPAGASILPYRSNIEKLSEFCFHVVDPTFHARALAAKNGIIVAGENYGQGSSREHAALTVMHLGIEAVLAKSFARIHRQNLINNGVLPLTFLHAEDYDSIQQGDILEIKDVTNITKDKCLTVYNHTQNNEFTVLHLLTQKEINMIKDGGLLNQLKKQLQK